MVTLGPNIFGLIREVAAIQKTSLEWSCGSFSVIDLITKVLDPHAKSRHIYGRDSANSVILSQPPFLERAWERGYIHTHTLSLSLTHTHTHAHTHTHTHTHTCEHTHVHTHTHLSQLDNLVATQTNLVVVQHRPNPQSVDQTIKHAPVLVWSFTGGAHESGLHEYHQFCRFWGGGGGVSKIHIDIIITENRVVMGTSLLISLADHRK